MFGIFWLVPLFFKTNEIPFYFLNYFFQFLLIFLLCLFWGVPCGLWDFSSQRRDWTLGSRQWKRCISCTAKEFLFEKDSKLVQLQRREQGKIWAHWTIFFFFFSNFFFILILAALSLHCCSGFSWVAASGGYGLLIAVASLAEHRL